MSEIILIIIGFAFAFVVGFSYGKKHMREYLTKEHESENEMFFKS